MVIYYNQFLNFYLYYIKNVLESHKDQQSNTKLLNTTFKNNEKKLMI